MVLPSFDQSPGNLVHFHENYPSNESGFSVLPACNKVIEERAINCTSYETMNIFNAFNSIILSGITFSVS